MKDYKFFLFDADGTLFDTGDLIYQCFLHTCRQLNFREITKQEVLSSMGLPLRKQFEKYLGPVEHDVYNEIQSEYMDYQMFIYKDYLKLFPETKETLEHLKSAGKNLAVVTSRKITSLSLYLKHTAVFDLFDVLVTPDMTIEHKPGAEPAIKAMSMLKAEKNKALFIGDSIYDIECGTKAGIDTAFVMWSYTDVKDLAVKPTFCINTMRELCC